MKLKPVIKEENSFHKWNYFKTLLITGRVREVRTVLIFPVSILLCLIIQNKEIWHLISENTFSQFKVELFITSPI